MIKIPLNSADSRVIVCPLRDYTLQFRTIYNERMGYYTLDILTETSEPLALGLTMKAFINLLCTQPTLTEKYGQFRVLGSGVDGARGRGSIGTIANLYHFDDEADFKLFSDLLGYDFSPEPETLPLSYDFNLLFPPARQLQ